MGKEHPREQIDPYKKFVFPNVKKFAKRTILEAVFGCEGVRIKMDIDGMISHLGEQRQG
jgi:hypothetical protein